MSDQPEDRMNLDLNLGPGAPRSPRLEPRLGLSSQPGPVIHFQVNNHLSELFDQRIRDILYSRWVRQSGGSSQTEVVGLGPSSTLTDHVDEGRSPEGSDQRTRGAPETNSRQPASVSPREDRLSGPSSVETAHFERPTLLNDPDFGDDSFNQGSSSRALDTALIGMEPVSPLDTDEHMPFVGIDYVDELDLARRGYGLGSREFVRSGMRRWRWRSSQAAPGVQDAAVRSMPVSSNIDTHAGEEDGAAMLQSGEGSAAAEARNSDTSKKCDGSMAQLEDVAVDKKNDVEGGGGVEGGFFDCNICLDMAREPVVTCCGHLFCWPCIYRWLNLHSDAKECPVCKGEVTAKTVTPIYGRGRNTRGADEELGIKIPMRPPARPVESLRQVIQRTATSFPVDEMIRRLGSRFERNRDFLQHQEFDNGARDTLERGNFLLNRILTSRGLRREQSVVVPAEDVVDLTQDGFTRPEVTERRRLPSLIYRRSYHRGASTALASMTAFGERMPETSSRVPPPAISQEQLPSVEDRDSFSSIAAVIHGESQTVDTAVEIDSMVSLSTSSSRRRNDASRVSDIDSGDSRAPRRRRLN